MKNNDGGGIAKCLQNILKSDSLLTRIHRKSIKAGLDKITDEDIEAEVKAVRKVKEKNNKAK